MLLLAGTALANPDRVVSVTASLPHAASAVGELTGEVRVLDELGVAAIAGLGAREGFVTGHGGLSGRWYPVGDFDHGVQVGAEVLYLRGGGARAGWDGTTRQLSAGPFVGYKATASFGLCFEMQAGPQYLSGSTTTSVGTTEERAWGLLLNIGLGWSFGGATPR